eukprot:7379950-Prymnesium_polylepis.1
MESAMTGIAEEVLIFKHYFLQDEGTEETVNISKIVNELTQYHDFFKKFKKGGKSDRTDLKGFEMWMTKNFAGVEYRTPHNFPAYKLKRKRERGHIPPHIRSHV